jgi:hypothetical protein
MTSSHLPDVNVWLAMHAERHQHHRIARAWSEALDERRPLVFCRQTQLSLFRLLTNPAVMDNEILTQRQCWAIYDEWLSAGRAVLEPEPLGIAPAFRGRTQAAEPATKRWTDSYLAAFAEAGAFTLVTFDKTLAGKVNGAVLLA